MNKSKTSKRIAPHSGKVSAKTFALICGVVIVLGILSLAVRNSLLLDKVTSSVAVNQSAQSIDRTNRQNLIPAVRDVEGNAYISSLRLKLPSETNTSIGNVQYFYDRSSTDETEQASLVNSVVLNDYRAKLFSARTQPELQSIALPMQQCTRQIVLSVGSRVPIQENDYSIYTTKTLRDGRTLNVFASKYCKDGIDGFAAYVATADSY